MHHHLLVEAVVAAGMFGLMTEQGRLAANTQALDVVVLGNPIERFQSRGSDNT